MRVQRSESGRWQIVDVPPYEVRERSGQVFTFTSYGPYMTKAEAESDMRGVSKVLKDENYK